MPHCAQEKTRKKLVETAGLTDDDDAALANIKQVCCVVIFACMTYCDGVCVHARVHRLIAFSRHETSTVRHISAQSQRQSEEKERQKRRRRRAARAL
jgi:hypothetical protein